jgi:type IV secretory pathway TrbD component
MANQPEVHPVHKSLNKILTIWGAERRLFLLTLLMASATFNFFGSLLSGLLMFAALYMFARWATINDPQILRILLNSSKYKARYDPAKRAEFSIVRIPRD